MTADDELQIACQRCWEMVFVYNTNDSILGRIPLVLGLPVCRLSPFMSSIFLLKSFSSQFDMASDAQP